MLPFAEDLDYPPEIGKRYRVRCALVRVIGPLKNAWVPIHGSEHRDPEISAVARIKHYHMFAPFVCDRLFDWFNDLGYEWMNGWAGYSWAAFNREEAAEYTRATGKALKNEILETRILTRKCRRDWPPFPELTALRTVLAPYARPLGFCRRCPHRGMNLAIVRPDENGVITCPMHGLKFNAVSGLPV